MYIKNKVHRKIAAWVVALPVWALIMWLLITIMTHSKEGMLVGFILLVLIERAVTGYDNKLSRDIARKKRIKALKGLSDSS